MILVKEKLCKLLNGKSKCKAHINDSHSPSVNPSKSGSSSELSESKWRAAASSCAGYMTFLAAFKASAIRSPSWEMILTAIRSFTEIPQALTEYRDHPKVSSRSSKALTSPGLASRLYSGTCLERPPHWPYKCGQERWSLVKGSTYYIEM